MELIELYEMAGEYHIDVDDFRLGTVKSMAQMAPDGTCHIALDTRRFQTQAEEIVAFAHELGHCAAGSFYNFHSPYDIRSRHESRANKKAAYILIPLDKLIDAVEKGGSSIWELSEYFNVTEEFMRMALEFYEHDLETACAEDREL